MLFPMIPPVISKHYIAPMTNVQYNPVASRVRMRQQVEGRAKWLMWGQQGRSDVYLA